MSPVQQQVVINSAMEDHPQSPTAPTLSQDTMSAASAPSTSSPAAPGLEQAPGSSEQPPVGQSVQHPAHRARDSAPQQGPLQTRLPLQPAQSAAQPMPATPAAACEQPQAEQTAASSSVAQLSPELQNPAAIQPEWPLSEQPQQELSVLSSEAAEMSWAGMPASPSASCTSVQPEHCLARHSVSPASSEAAPESRPLTAAEQKPNAAQPPLASSSVRASPNRCLTGSAELCGSNAAAGVSNDEGAAAVSACQGLDAVAAAAAHSQVAKGGHPCWSSVDWSNDEGDAGAPETFAWAADWGRAQCCCSRAMCKLQCRHHYAFPVWLIQRIPVQSQSSALEKRRCTPCW